MEGVQNWFSPLLWILGTITAVVAFVRLCTPLWAFVKLPKELLSKVEENDQKDQERFDNLNSRLDKQQEELCALTKKVEVIDQIQLSLLHDRISEIYKNAMQTKYISDTDYHRACELYKKNGESDYITTLMGELKILHKQSVVNIDPED